MIKEKIEWIRNVLHKEEGLLVDAAVVADVLNGATGYDEELTDIILDLDYEWCVD